MVEFNRQERIVKVKIAYYGPAVGGKTTNLKVLYDRARGGRRGEFVSVNSQQDRTILCDLLPLKSGGFRGVDLRFQLAAVPGQAIYAPARRVVLRGSDGVVFVANSATDRFHENVQASASCRGTCSRSSSTRPRSRWCCSTTSGTCPTCWRPGPRPRR